MNKNRIITFDGVRGIAVLAVVLSHCFGVPGYAVHFPGQLFFYGFTGVELFFIISGFVISFTLYKYNNIKSFVIARFARLYPPYWATIIFSAILVLSVHGHLSLSQYLMNFLMFQGLLHVPGVSGVFWTLSYELSFYVIAATIFYFGFFSKHKVFVAWLIVTFIWQLANMNGYVPHHSFMSRAGCLLVLQYSPFFIFGIYLHKAFSHGWTRPVIFILATSAILSATLLPGGPGSNSDTNLAIFRVYVCIIFLLCAYATYFSEDKYLASKSLVFLGRISYSWYLTHLIIAEFIFSVLPSSLILIAPYLSLITSFFIAILFNKYIENPSHNFVLRYFKIAHSKVNYIMADDNGG